MTPPEARFVTVSGIAVPTAGAAALEVAVQNRSGLVESEPGFGGLQVWRPLRAGDPCTERGLVQE
jgi:heme-degrading monooxygenase HmoA